MSCKIGSLNIHKRRHLESERDLFSFIHDFVTDENLDILALQECANENELKRICQRCFSSLRNWKGHYERPASGRSGDYGFAFLWNENRVTECSKEQQPRIFKEYKSNDVRLSRDPLYGRFALKLSPTTQLQQELRLINIHLRFSDEILPDLSRISGIDKRKKEYVIVTNQIYKKIEQHRYGDFKSAFTLVLGDYNLSVDDCMDLTVNQDIQTYQKENTTLNSNFSGYSSSYDHFSYNVRNQEPVKLIKRIDAVNKYFDGNYKKYYQAVSDHIPIVIEVF